jgi:hypothetical protein
LIQIAILTGFRERHRQMKLTDISVSQLERLIPLLKEKESLQAKLDKVNADLSRLEGGKPVAVKNGKLEVVPKTRKRRSRRRGGMQGAVLKVLGAAGAKGVKVKELAAMAKVNPASLNTWLYTAGKKISGLKKLAPGLFAYQA